MARLAALRAFEAFAQATPHADVVAAGVRADQQPLVARFVRRDAAQPTTTKTTTSDRRLAWLRSQTPVVRFDAQYLFNDALTDQSGRSR